MGHNTDWVLLLDYRVTCEEKKEKAIILKKEVISLISETTKEYTLFVSKLYPNLDGLYKKAGKRNPAQLVMEQDIQIFEHA